jgi:hypothetical protein
MRQVLTAKNFTRIVIIGAFLGTVAGLVTFAFGVSLNVSVPIAAGTTGVVSAIIVGRRMSHSE